MIEAGLILLAALAVVVALLLQLGARRWQAGTEKLHQRLRVARKTLPPCTFEPAELEGLPEPVERYLRAVLRPGQPILAGVRLRQEGQFNTREDGERWAPFTATHTVATQPPGFVWDARVRMAPGLTAYVHDAYLAGEGLLLASLAGLVAVTKVQGTPEVAEGELMRFLAEAPWYPTALLPSQGVSWEPLDERSSRATLTDGATTVSLDFGFGSFGLIETVRAKARYRTIGKTWVPTPWLGRFSTYERRSDILVPMEGEVAWLLPRGPKPYWRARITAWEADLPHQALESGSPPCSAKSCSAASPLETG